MDGEGMEKVEGSEQNGNGEVESEQQLSSLKEELLSERKERERQANLAADYLTTAKRVQAEFENYKKRTEREREEIVKYANQRLLCDLLTVFDDFERALASQCSEGELRGGIEKVRDNLAAILKDNGVREIPANGQFDPSLHEALALGEGEDGKILEVFQKGYYLGDKVLRCSKVMVAKNKGDNNG